MASQTITGRELQYTQDNKHSFAYSGAIGIVQSDTTMLEFSNSSSNYIYAIFRFNSQTTDDDLRFTIEINGEIVQGYTIGSSPNHSFQEDLKIIIPPGSALKCFGYNESSNTSRTAYASMTGRVYGHLPVRN